MQTYYILINSDDLLRILQNTGAKNVPKEITEKEELKVKLMIWGHSETSANYILSKSGVSV